MHRHTVSLLLVTLAVVVAVPTTSEAQQSLNLSVGGFSPRSEEARRRTDGRSGDVLYNNLDFLAFDIRDFAGGSASAEYLVGVGEWLEAGLGVGIYQRTVRSVYADLVAPSGREIEQDLRLRIVPFTATVRLLPLGRSDGLVPYIGGGAGVLAWHYSERGEFVDPFDDTIFSGTYTGSGSATGPVVLGGLRIPLGSWDIGGEVRYQKAIGDLPIDQEFSSNRIDLGGWTYSVTFNIHF